MNRLMRRVSFRPRWLILFFSIALDVVLTDDDAPDNLARIIEADTTRNTMPDLNLWPMATEGFVKLQWKNYDVVPKGGNNKAVSIANFPPTGLSP